MMTVEASQRPTLTDALRSASFQLLGPVSEGRDTVHVLGRISMLLDGLAVPQMEVTSLMRVGSTWRVLLKGEVVLMASVLVGP
jgi:hypothetical protein